MANIKGLKFTEKIIYEIAVMGGPGSGHHGHGGRPGSVGGSAPGFISSPIGMSLQALSNDYDFVLFGSAAVALHTNSGTPGDIDVLDFTQKVKFVSERWNVLRDPRSKGETYNITDQETGVQIQTFHSNTLISKPLNGFTTTFRTPATHDMTGKPLYESKLGINVLKPKPLLNHLYEKASYDDIQTMIKKLNLPREFIDKKWYKMEYDEVSSGRG